MASPVWATLRAPPQGTPFRSYELYSTPLGLRSRHVANTAEHLALIVANTAGTLKFLDIETLRAYGCSPDPLAP